MRLSLDVLTILALLGAVQLTLIAAGFAFSRALAHRLFAGFTFSIAMMMFGAVAMQSELVRRFPHLAYVHSPANFLIGPLFFLFVTVMLGGALSWKSWLHAIPSIACALSLAPFYLLSVDAKRAALEHAAGASTIRTWLLLAQALLYTAAALWQLRKHDRERRMPMLWMGTASLALFALAGIARMLADASPLLVPAAITLLAIAMSIAALRPHAREERRKYAHSTLTGDRGERYLGRLVEHFEREKPFLAPELSLEALAQQLAMPPSHLSQIVNERLGCSFREWLNSWRVEEAKRRLTDEQYAHLSIVAIGEASGFRSKSAFHAAFRRQTAMSPAEFRRTSGSESCSETS